MSYVADDFSTRTAIPCSLTALRDLCERNRDEGGFVTIGRSKRDRVFDALPLLHSEEIRVVGLVAADELDVNAVVVGQLLDQVGFGCAGDVGVDLLAYIDGY